ncbi:unnamed protein product [Eruca vesicaria subsp. sativa]|uniref:Uncharacterized protein n=1 Tax=Eruca vesicaria subsp. sativa TaxID=29727 RepID=A0ABC8LDS9_ERUVS|nr:unnamed protein product [Eruca vesicaria subsp. sativa]
MHKAPRFNSTINGQSTLLEAMINKMARTIGKATASQFINIVAPGLGESNWAGAAYMIDMNRLHCYSHSWVHSSNRVARLPGCYRKFYSYSDVNHNINVLELFPQLNVLIHGIL